MLRGKIEPAPPLPVPFPKIVMKARPTAGQLADRLRAPAPEGLELYLDAADVASPDYLPMLLDRIAVAAPPAGFTFLVEGPVRSLDGEFFDLTVDSEANRLVVARLAAVGQALGAVAACVHLIAPTNDLTGTPPDVALGLVESCQPLAAYYAARCKDAGLVPTVENIPPIAQMRESRVMTSTVGGPPEHLAWLADRIDGLRFTVDTSHAQLFLNAAGADPAYDPRLSGLVRALAASSPARDFAAFLEPLRGRIETAHVSDADGLFGEGLPYGAGTMPLDDAVDRLLVEARWLVTEILEPDPNTSSNMRAAWERIATRRERLAVAA